MEGKVLARYIDHTLLKPNATAKDIQQLCLEAKHYGFATVCVNGRWVQLAAQCLTGTKVGVCSVVGFPLGASPSLIKAIESRKAIHDGATEIDMVMDIGSMLDVDVRSLIDFANHHGSAKGFVGSQAIDIVLNDIKTVVQACGEVPVKVIIETVFLNKEQKEVACMIAQSAGAAFVKTCTGFSGGKATVMDICLMRNAVGPNMGVKASGGIKTKDDALNMIAAGANRLGASSGIQIVNG
jgi:deoxyribose-phosphate aldolase